MKRAGVIVVACILAFCAAILCGDKKLTPERQEGVQTATGTSVRTTKQPETPTASPAATITIQATKKPVKRSVPKIHSNAKVKDYGNGVVSVGDTAYEQYNYIEPMAKRYAAVVNKLAKKLKGKAKVYDMLVPTSIGVILPDNKKNKVSSSDQKKAIEAMYGMLSARVTAIPVYEELMQHRNEYIYFRTDHHWTPLGAYYAYDMFCEATDRDAYSLGDYKKESFGDYLGTFYSDTGKNPNLKKDKMKVYYPVCNNKIKMKYITQTGQVYTGNIIENGKNYGIGLKYVALIGGDNPYTTITNKKIKDNSSIVVVKESFGNALVPYLADHYHKVYVVDYRYWENSLEELVTEKKISEVLFVNNISMTRNSYLLGKLSSVIDK